MVALPMPRERPRLLTAAEFAALPEDAQAHYELQEGVVVMSPRARARHQVCLGRLYSSLTGQVPDGWEVVPEVDVDLELVGPDRPGFVRAPDLVVVRREALARLEAEGGIVRAGEAELAVEIVSPSTRRADTVVKHGEYADAGIPHYWIVDISDGVSLTACHLAGEFGYAEAPAVRGRCHLDRPFPVHLDLDSLG